MSHSSSPLNTPLSRVRGLGSAKDGTSHWWYQRVTAILLVPLVLWFVFSFTDLVVNGSRMSVSDWFGSPINTVATLILFSAMFYHARLGLQVVIEDYIHCKCVKNASLIGLNILFFGATAISWMAVLKLHIVGI